MQKVVWPLLINLLFAALFSVVVFNGAVAAESEQATTESEQSTKEAKELIDAVLNLTEEEGAAFWPLFEEYRGKVREYNGQAFDLIVEYAEAREAGGLSDARALEMVDTMLVLDTGKNNVTREYFKKFKEVLPPSKYVRFFQVDRRVDMVSRLFMASNAPLFESTESGAAPAAK